MCGLPCPTIGDPLGARRAGGIFSSQFYRCSSATNPASEEWGSMTSLRSGEFRKGSVSVLSGELQPSDHRFGGIVAFFARGDEVRWQYLVPPTKFFGEQRKQCVSTC